MKKQLFFLMWMVAAVTAEAQVQTGKASYYADRFEGKPTASGEKYRHNKLTAAHKTLPFGTRVRVTNLANQAWVEVVINDRGPFVEDRIIDLSRAAAEKLGFIVQGIAEVKVEVIDPGTGKVSDPARPIGNVAVDEKEFYSTEISRTTPLGFGVQIGTFQELVNLLRLTDNLKKSYQKKIIIQVKVINGVKFYSLIIGQFPNRAKAEALREELRKRYPDAFIVEFNRL